MIVDGQKKFFVKYTNKRVFIKYIFLIINGLLLFEILSLINKIILKKLSKI